MSLLEAKPVLLSLQADRQHHAATVSDFRKNLLKEGKLLQELGRRLMLVCSSSRTQINVIALLSKPEQKGSMP
jgi:hypothetical protein